MQGKHCTHILHNSILASCPLGPATAREVGLFTEMYAIYMERYSSHRAIARGPRDNSSTFFRL